MYLTISPHSNQYEPSEKRRACFPLSGGSRLSYAAGDGLQILQIRERDIVFQVVPCQVSVKDSMGLGNGLFVPHLLLCAGGFRENGLRLFLAASGFFLELWNRGNLISRPPGHIWMNHALLCHFDHLQVIIPQCE